MPNASKIPLRPKDFVSNLPQPQQACLTWYVISGCSRKEAFITFARPDMLDSKAKAAIDSYVKQFFASKDAIDYITAYEATLEEFLHPKPVKKEENGTLEERKARTKTRLIEFAMSLADDIEKADDKEFVLKMADKAGLLDSDDEVEEQPRRYLPVTCSECNYRKFIEENCDVANSGTEFVGQDSTAL